MEHAKTFTHLYDYAKGAFISYMRMLTPELQRWIQYVGFTYNKDTDTVTFKFKSSQHGIYFKIEAKAFSGIYGVPMHVPVNETYDYFRELKYETFPGCKQLA